MYKQVEISICIPAYKNTAYLERLLDSISQQTYTDYEVIITDDSPDETVKLFLSDYTKIENIKHYQNKPALGTPENWNEGIRRATGKWIKLMHDDDWFASKESLKNFANAANANPDCAFFFSAFQNVVAESNKIEIVKCGFLDGLILKLSPLHLFKRVYVGNPSCTFIRRDAGELYDSRFKFVVDFEYYIRCFQLLKSYRYIDKVLLNIGFNDEQVTKYTFLVPAVQIPENLVLLEKLGTKILRNIIVYDYYWRMFRNLKTRNVEEVKAFYQGEIPLIIQKMINWQSVFSLGILKLGIVSKCLMMFSYLRSLFISTH